jgi:hypothetical protein
MSGLEDLSHRAAEELKLFCRQICHRAETLASRRPQEDQSQDNL